MNAVTLCNVCLISQVIETFSERNIGVGGWGGLFFGVFGGSLLSSSSFFLLCSCLISTLEESVGLSLVL